MATWLYECDHGQGAVQAHSPDAARRRAVREAGTLAEVRNVRPATRKELAFRRAMGGTLAA